MNNFRFTRSNLGSFPFHYFVDLLFFLFLQNENDANPLANLFFSSSTIRTFSPLLKPPLIDFIPAANKLLPFFNALAAPLSMHIDPEELNELTIHFFLAAKVDIFGTNFVKIFLFDHFLIGLFTLPFAINM